MGEPVELFKTDIRLRCPNHKTRLADMLKLNNLKSITLVHMEVGCCYGLSKLVKSALQESGEETQLKEVVIGVDGSLK